MRYAWELTCAFVSIMVDALRRRWTATPNHEEHDDAR